MWIGYFYLEFFSPQCAMLFSSLYHAWTLARKSICMLLDSTDKVNSVFSFLQLMDNDKMTQTGEQFKKGNWKLNFVYDASWKVGMKWSQVKSLSLVRLFATPWTVAYHAPGKSTGVGCHFLLQRIFQTQGSNLGLPHCRQMLYRVKCL